MLLKLNKTKTDIVNVEKKKEKANKKLLRIEMPVAPSKKEGKKLMRVEGPPMTYPSNLITSMDQLPSVTPGCLKEQKLLPILRPGSPVSSPFFPPFTPDAMMTHSPTIYAWQGLQACHGVPIWPCKKAGRRHNLRTTGIRVSHCWKSSNGKCSCVQFVFLPKLPFNAKYIFTGKGSSKRACACRTTGKLRTESFYLCTLLLNQND